MRPCRSSPILGRRTGFDGSLSGHGHRRSCSRPNEPQPARDGIRHVWLSDASGDTWRSTWKDDPSPARALSKVKRNQRAKKEPNAHRPTEENNESDPKPRLPAGLPGIVAQAAPSSPGRCAGDPVRSPQSHNRTARLLVPAILIRFCQRSPGEGTRPTRPQTDPLVGRVSSPGIPVWSIMRIAVKPIALRERTQPP